MDMAQIGVRLSGFLIMTIGIFLLLNALGYVPEVGKIILIALSLYLIFKGFLKSGLYHMLVKKNTHNDSH